MLTESLDVFELGLRGVSFGTVVAAGNCRK